MGSQGAGAFSQADLPPPSLGKRFKAAPAGSQGAGGGGSGGSGGGGSGGVRRWSGSAGRYSAADAMRARARAEQGRGRAQAVTAYRQYRKGELPDIQISPRDLLAPLQALAHHDTLVAKLCFGQVRAAPPYSPRAHPRQLSLSPFAQQKKLVLRVLASHTHLFSPTTVRCCSSLGPPAVHERAQGATRRGRQGGGGGDGRAARRHPAPARE